MGNVVAMVLMSGVLVCAAWFDIKTQKVPNKLVLPAILVGWIWWLVWGAVGNEPNLTAWTGFRDSLIGFAAGFFPFAVVYASGALGGGDVKTMGAVGALSAQWETVLSTTVYACVVAALIAIFVMIQKGLVIQTFRRLFGMALVKASGAKPDMPEDSPKIPFALAIAVGGIVAGLETLLNVNTPWAGF